MHFIPMIRAITFYLKQNGEIVYLFVKEAIRREWEDRSDLRFSGEEQGHIIEDDIMGSPEPLNFILSSC